MFRRLFAPLVGLFAGGAAVAAVAADLVIEDVREGEGPAAKAGDQVVVHYDGRLANGTPFDSSRQRGQPFSFQLGAGQVIKGWDQGVEGMKPGGLRQLTIPPELGYGSRGVGPIPGGATLVFDVELLEIR
ncbi:MAG: FKBP-type peptidyl-prolyl cis-trans isomerase [Pseudomonadota bacterium]